MAGHDLQNSSMFTKGEMVALVFLKHVLSKAPIINARPGPSEILILGYGRFACTCKLFYQFIFDQYVREHFFFEYYKLFEM